MSFKPIKNHKKIPIISKKLKNKKRYAKIVSWYRTTVILYWQVLLQRANSRIHKRKNKIKVNNKIIGLLLRVKLMIQASLLKKTHL